MAQARGDKRTQFKDIEYACACWQDWKERGHEQAQSYPAQLYRTLSPDGNPSLSTLTAILDAMGLRLAVEPRQPFPTPAG